MKFAKILFYVAGVYGLVNLVPQYFLEEKIGRDFPPAIEHPEFFYGFLGVAIAWQVMFLVIGSNPARLRPAMIPSVIEKFSFAVATIVLFARERLAGTVLVFGLIDLVLGTLFVVAFIATRPED